MNGKKFWGSVHVAYLKLQNFSLYDQTVLQRLIKGFNAHIIFVIIIKPSISTLKLWNTMLPKLWPLSIYIMQYISNQ